jgi:UTP--glucose-1-phosphate uridylyltransferase
MLVLGDHLFVPSGTVGCARQLVNRFEEMETPLIALQATPESEIGRFGAVGGSWVSGDERRDLLEITLFKEKPDKDFALEFLEVAGLPEKTYFAVFGLYILPHGLFDELARASRDDDSSREVQLTDALEQLREKEHFLGLVIQGEKVDIGLPDGYLSGLMKFAGRT